MIATLVVLGIALTVLAVVYSTSYNGLVSDRQQVADAWAVIDGELERRHALVPGLVSAVRATAVHERELLQRLIEADRRSGEATRTAADRSSPEAELAAAASAVIALREQYPALNSQQNFLQLQKELATTEDRIGAARRFHNIKVAEYNRSIQAVPGNLVARRHHFDPAAYFGTD